MVRRIVSHRQSGLKLGVSAMLAAGCAFILTSASSAGTLAVQPRAGAPLAGLTAYQLERFEAGKSSYTQTLGSADGLGPLFNQTSCGNCHANPVGGPGSILVHRFGTLDGQGQFDDMADLGGSLLQANAISEECQEFIPETATITADRVTNGALAYGLVEAIPDSQILAHVGGKGGGIAHMVEAFEDGEGAKPRVGRFGWKAQVATVLTFSADAGLNELGLTNHFIHGENSPNGDTELLAKCDQVADPEDNTDLGKGDTMINRWTDFQRLLAAPPQTPKNGMAGEALFMSIGCSDCHVPQFTTARKSNGFSEVLTLENAIANQTIRPYSDWLLHNMGSLGDGIVQGAGTGERMKTPPLWGVRFRNPMLHDGRVDFLDASQFGARITAAIEWHNVPRSEAAQAAAKFLSGAPNTLNTGTYPVVAGGLNNAQRAQVIAFLDSLGKREFDGTGDGLVNLDDFISFQGCFNDVGVTPNDPCAVHDIDQNGTVNLADFAFFQTVYEGPNGDCNENGVPDLQDILVGTSQDADLNGFPDDCTCTADFTGDFSVDGIDLGILLSTWSIPATAPGCGGLEPCFTDMNKDGFVNGIDLGILLANWGSCF